MMKLNNYPPAICAMALGLVLATPANAANCANISFSPSSTPVISYDPIKATQSATTTVNVTLSGYAANDKDYRLILTDSLPTTPLRIGLAGPVYTITQGGETISFPAATVPATAPVSTKSLTTATIPLTIALPVNSGTDYTGGTSYSESLGYSLQCYKANGSASGLDVGTATSLNAQIAKVLSVVTGSPQTLNFGNFTTTSQTLQVNLKSTNTITVSVSTAKGSQMALTGAVAPFPANSTIPYTMTFGGNAITTSAAITVPRASVAGSNYAFVLSLPGGIPSGKLPGSYSDVITLTIVPSP